MDFFERDDLETLLRHSAQPAVSIYLPNDGAAPDPDRARLRFRAALERARALIDADPRYDDEDILTPLLPLAKEREHWNSQGGAFALFHSAEISRRYRLPAAFPELVVVGPTFHTRPLLDYLQNPNRFWVLELGQGQVRLWRGDAERMRPLEGTSLPRDLQEALGYEFTRDPEIVHRAGAKSGRGGNIRAQRGGSVGAFHGHGVGVDDRQPELRRFFKIVDDAVREYLGRAGGPVILAAVAEHHPLYREVSRLDRLAPEGIEASVRDWSPDRLHGAAWPIAVKAAEKRIDEALALWETSYGRGKGEADPANLGAFAVAGRIRLLMTERDRRLWGTIDPQTGKLEVRQVGGEDPGAETVDLLDELSEIVLLYRGETLVLPSGRMPTDTGLAGVLR
ncbi:MAG: hypothetical protein ACRELC_06390 [Gemmatimonadota bacterium]